MKRRVLVVDDDRKTVDLIRLYLERDGHRVAVANDGAQALDLAGQQPFDLIVLDLMMPLVDGLTVCRELREVSRVPIIMLTARTTEEDKLLGLNSGADDYVSKPFSPRELVARVRAVLRRTSDGDDATVQHKGLTVDHARHEVAVQGAVVHLTPKEFRLLETLVREPGRVFSRSELINRVLGYGYEGLERTIDVHLLNLRRKIEPNPTQPIYIETVYGVGYRFSDESEVSDIA